MKHPHSKHMRPKRVLTNREHAELQFGLKESLLTFEDTLSFLFFILKQQTSKFAGYHSLHNNHQFPLINPYSSLSTSAIMATIPFDPDSSSFPSRKDLPVIPGAPPGAAWVWGPDDSLGRLNLLTPIRIAAAAKLIIKGEVVPLNLPLDVPKVPSFGRQPFHHEIKALAPGLAYDDIYHLNTQSGTQWDGFRHVAHMKTGKFYNGATAEDIQGEKATLRDSIHHWAEKGLAGRGILLDYWGYAKEKGLRYDPFEWHAISLEELRACGESQGVDIRPKAQGGDVEVGDFLFIRSGWCDAYEGMSPEEREKAALRPHKLGPDDGQRYVHA